MNMLRPIHEVALIPERAPVFEGIPNPASLWMEIPFLAMAQGMSGRVSRPRPHTITEQLNSKYRWLATDRVASSWGSILDNIAFTPISSTEPLSTLEYTYMLGLETVHAPVVRTPPGGLALSSTPDHTSFTLSMVMYVHSGIVLMEGNGITLRYRQNMEWVAGGGIASTALARPIADCMPLVVTVTGSMTDRRISLTSSSSPHIFNTMSNVQTHSWIGTDFKLGVDSSLSLLDICYWDEVLPQSTIDANHLLFFSVHGTS